MPRKPNEPLPSDPALLEPITKAAILLMTLDTPTAALLRARAPLLGREPLVELIARMTR